MAFTKIINPIMKKSPRTGNWYNVFITIEVREDGELSITGVEGPLPKGDCIGSCGQINHTLLADDRSGWRYTEDWNAEMMDRLLEIWDRWHLNHMNAACEHQRADGWREKAVKQVTLYHWRKTREALEARKAAETAALTALRSGESFTPTPEQAFMSNLPYTQTTHTAELPAEIAGYYEPKKPLHAGDVGHTEVKTLGWLRQTEHPDGILSRPCPVCDYQYGSRWLKEALPQDVAEWLAALPESNEKSAWA